MAEELMHVWYSASVQERHGSDLLYKLEDGQIVPCTYATAVKENGAEQGGMYMGRGSYYRGTMSGAMPGANLHVFFDPGPTIQTVKIVGGLNLGPDLGRINRRLKGVRF